MKKLTPCLWFDSNAEEAVNFYVSIFKNSKIKGITYYGESGSKATGRPAGSVLTIAFQINKQDFLALNGGPVFTFSPAISFIVNCETQEEIDEFWEKLSQGGKPQQCGWVQDKFGVSWQIVPEILGKMMLNKNKEKAEKVMQALFQMNKIDIETLKKAYEER